MRLVDTSATVTVNRPDDSGDYLVLRQNISKREMNIVLGSLPQSAFAAAAEEAPVKGKKGKAVKVEPQAISFTFTEGMGMAYGLFEAFVTDWSLDEPATKANYLRLDPTDGSWVDSVLFDHFNAVQSKDRADVEGPSTSPSN